MEFVQLRAFKTKGADEIAYHLLDVFTKSGANCIFQSGNCWEFANKIIEVCELKIVHRGIVQGIVEVLYSLYKAPSIARLSRYCKPSHWKHVIHFAWI